MEPTIEKFLQGIPFAGMCSTLERNGLIGVVRELIKANKYTVDYILNYCESVGYQRKMTEEVFEELTGLSPKLIINNNEYYNAPIYVPACTIAWGLAKSKKDVAFYVVPGSYGYSVMEKNETDTPVEITQTATIPEAIDELKKVAKNIQTLDKIITSKLLETEDIQSSANDVNQTAKPYFSDPVRELKKNFKDKVIDVNKFEREAKKLVAEEKLTINEAEDLMDWKQRLVDEDECYANEVLQINENWKPLDAEDIDENAPDYEERVQEAYKQLAGMIEETDILADYAKRSGDLRLFDAYIQLGREIAEEWEVKPEAVFGEMALSSPELTQKLEQIDLEKFNKEVETWKRFQEKFPWKGGNKQVSKKVKSWNSEEDDEYRNSEEYLDSYEYLYSQLVNGNLDLYREKLNKLTKPQLIEYIEWANEIGIGREELKLGKYVQSGKKQASSENIDGIKVTTYDHGSRGVAYSAEGLTYEDCGKVYTELCNKYDSVDKSKVIMDEFKDKCHGYFLCKKSASKKQATSEEYAIENGDVINTDDLIFYYADHKKEFMDDYYGDNAAMQSEVDYDFLEKHIDEIFKAWADELVDKIITDDWEEWKAAEKAYYDVYNKNGFKMNKLSSKKKASKKVTAENMDLDDIKEEDKTEVEQEIDKIDETPIDELLEDNTPLDYFEKETQNDKVDTINDVVSRCITEFSDKFKDFDKYDVKMLSYKTKILAPYTPNQDEMIPDNEVNADAVLQVILAINNKADDSDIKKVLAVFSITDGKMHWTGTVRDENDKVVAFTEQGLDSIFNEEEPEEVEEVI